MWRMVGRVSFHLAENKQHPTHPFAFMASYASRISSQSRVQHLPLGRALQEYATAKDKQALINLLTPVHKAAEKSGLIKELVDSSRIFKPLPWTPVEAYRFLKEAAVCEEGGRREAARLDRVLVHYDQLNQLLAERARASEEHCDQRLSSPNSSSFDWPR